MDERELFLNLLELERGSYHSHLLRCKPNATPAPPIVSSDDFTMNRFEQWSEAVPDLIDGATLDGEPTALEMDVLMLLPSNLNISIISKTVNCTYDQVRRALDKLHRRGLVDRLLNRRCWPNERGFALIGIPVTPPPRHPSGKAGVSIYFGKAEPQPPKPKPQLPQNINITESDEGFFINVNGVTLDVPFDSFELAQRGADAWWQAKPSKKGIADYFKRKRAALFQFIGDDHDD